MLPQPDAIAQSMIKTQYYYFLHAVLRCQPTTVPSSCLEMMSEPCFSTQPAELPAPAVPHAGYGCHGTPEPCAAQGL